MLYSAISAFFNVSHTSQMFQVTNNFILLLEVVSTAQCSTNKTCAIFFIKTIKQVWIIKLCT